MTELGKMDELILCVREWGRSKGITGPTGTGTTKRQYDKLEEEFKELGTALSYNDVDEVIDAIGDMTVVIILLCDLISKEYKLNIDMFDCLQSAYNVISKRTGKMINGQFVKDS